MAGKVTKRIPYIDWMRGLACLIMLQGHCFDSWLSPMAREGTAFGWSQLIDTLPAPLFLFISGFSIAIVTDKLRQRGNSSAAIAKKTILRGFQVLGFGILFRFQEFFFGQPWAPWTDLFRVDVLNVIGLSLIMMGLACRIAASGPSQNPADVRRASIITAITAGACIALITPNIWTVWRPTWLPWWLESYFDGVHIFGKPQAYLFPFFPWAAFAFAGLAVGFLLLSDWARANEVQVTRWAAFGGIALIAVGYLLDAQPFHLYSHYDFWHTSPNFLLMRVGIVLILLKVSHIWSHLRLANWGFSPLLELGKSSMLVYWVHSELVYGRYSILPKGAVGVASAALGVLTIYAAMITLVTVRNRFPYRGMEFLAMFRRLARSESSS
ncbi:MAG TPA: heparan-alpha-glucosaminide N-acetyltransferase domain-containing protein [Candidatus Dormibacteraeota bacterium]|nr:heparan-alpha-glucosaminide N-acetyltransferase domain-containing protein [Candidatus Dormibacteraeota bacterium]